MFVQHERLTERRNSMLTRPRGAGGATAVFCISALCIAAMAAGCAAGEEPLPGAKRGGPPMRTRAGAAEPGTASASASEPLIQRVAPNGTTGDFDGDGLEDVAYGDRTWGAGTACPAGYG